MYNITNYYNVCLQHIRKKTDTSTCILRGYPNYDSKHYSLLNPLTVFALFLYENVTCDLTNINKF